MGNNRDLLELVAKAAGLRVVPEPAPGVQWTEGMFVWAAYKNCPAKVTGFDRDGPLLAYWNPLTNWEDGGPIIEREFIAVHPNYIRDGSGTLPVGREWVAVAHGVPGSGPTPLIAAMRAFVAAALHRGTVT